MSEVQESENDKLESNAVLDAQEIAEDEIKKLKGDIVGDTLYSGKWIIGILLSVSKVTIVVFKLHLFQACINFLSVHVNFYYKLFVLNKQ